MKENILKILKEEVGVPKGILEVSESIINWGLYHKIKKTPIVIETKFKKY